jgi:hypothetical protein
MHRVLVDARHGANAHCLDGGEQPILHESHNVLGRLPDLRDYQGFVAEGGSLVLKTVR